jgi:AAA15 family ATPase/GTPase
MLHEMKIQNFRGIDGLKLKQPTKFNLLVGPNNSGKTSLLETLFLFCAPTNMRIVLSIISFRHGGFTGNPRYIFERIKWFFNNPQDHHSLNLIINGKWNDVNREVELDLSDYAMDLESTKRIGTETTTTLPPEVIERNMITKEGVESTHIGKLEMCFKSDIQNQISQEFDFHDAKDITFSPAKIKTDIPAKYVSPFQHKNPEAGVEEWDKSTKKKHEKKCLDLVRKIDDEIEDISILLAPGKVAELHMDHKQLGIAPLSNLGDGIRRIVYLASSLVECENGILLIDELESSIHSNALNKLMNWLLESAKKLNIQIFASTHSLNCIDAVLKSSSDIVKDLSLYKIESYEGKGSCKKIPGESLKQLRYELGQDVR